jgi:hypothetical protein
MNNTAEYLPFHAINEFMRPDFRLSLIRETLNALPNLPDEHNDRINRLTKQLVKVPGFRNSEKAPTLMKVVPMSKSFEKSAELVAAILAAWAEVNSDLRLQVFNLLKDRGWAILSTEQPLCIETLSPEIMQKWPVLPPEIDRTKLPGFYIRWPKGEDYEKLYDHYTKTYPTEEISIDKVSLMVVWLSLRLPYQMEEIESLNTTGSSNREDQPLASDRTIYDEKGLDI